MADDDGWDVELDDLTPDPEREELERIQESDPEPQSVRLENAAFVLLGVAVTLGVVYVGFL